MLAPFQLFNVQPWLVALPSLAFFALWWWSRTRFALAAAVLWALYGVWEWSIAAGYACDGECDIRVDLLAIAPVLLLVSVAALIRSVQKRRRRA